MRYFLFDAQKCFTTHWNFQILVMYCKQSVISKIKPGLRFGRSDWFRDITTYVIFALRGLNILESGENCDIFFYIHFQLIVWYPVHFLYVQIVYRKEYSYVNLIHAKHPRNLNYILVIHASECHGVQCIGALTVYVITTVLLK